MHIKTVSICHSKTQEMFKMSSAATQQASTKAPSQNLSCYSGPNPTQPMGQPNPWPTLGCELRGRWIRHCPRRSRCSYCSCCSSSWITVPLSAARLKSSPGRRSPAHLLAAAVSLLQPPLAGISITTNGRTDGGLISPVRKPRSVASPGFAWQV